MKESAISFQRFEIKREVGGGGFLTTATMCMYGSSDFDAHVHPLCICSVLCRTLRTSSLTACIQLHPQRSSPSDRKHPQTHCLINKNLLVIATLCFCKYVSNTSRQTLNRLLTHRCVFGFSSRKSLLLYPTEAYMM